MKSEIQLALAFDRAQNAPSTGMTHRISRSLRLLGRGIEHTDAQAIAPLIRRGMDPLGQHFVESVSPEDRRSQGATFTPAWLVALMLDQVAERCVPARVIDAGAGTGRYAVAAARRWPDAEVIAIEKDPVLAAAARIHASVANVKVRVICSDYLDVQLPRIPGVTAFVGNPPYVRHHDISEGAKRWYGDRMARLGLPSSLLAGLHVYFFLQSFLLSRPGDVGCFVTAAEWLETNYGESMRSLFCRMGGDSLLRADPEQPIFDDALTTSVVTGWTTGSNGPVRIGDFQLGVTHPGFAATHEQLLALPKWPAYGNPLPPVAPAGPKLGDYFRVSRGQVTGCNPVWVANADSAKLIPERYLVPCVCDAQDIIEANGVLRRSDQLKRVIDLPADLGELTRGERVRVDEFLATAEAFGARDSYISQHRTPWWRVGLKSPPAIIMSYMGRRPPVFARNAAGVPILNIAHGLVPTAPISVSSQNRLVAWLNQNVSVAAGRTYGGGLVKFEPREAMRIPLPPQAVLEE
ncbi:MAG: methyltransferase domain-containing protein [Verrucomicrobia bacterium]|nr:methyltransferase domain-containing protein [Verrucomicrobiota bacterium]